MTSLFILSGLLALVIGLCGKDGSMLAVAGILLFLGIDFWACLGLFLCLGVLMLPITFLYNLGTRR